jgi:hypothetical protein
MEKNQLMGFLDFFNLEPFYARFLKQNNMKDRQAWEQNYARINKLRSETEIESITNILPTAWVAIGSSMHFEPHFLLAIISMAFCPSAWFDFITI